VRISEPLVPGFEGSFALDAVAFFFVADLAAEVFFEWREFQPKKVDELRL
jgi:hypothetical protein